jgi:hypothetical protein
VSGVGTPCPEGVFTVNRFFPAVAVIGALVLSAPVAQAQEVAAGDWKQTVFIYGMGAAIDGDAQIGPLKLPVDVSISDLFDALKFGAMGSYRIENDEWSFMGDITYMTLGWNARGERGKVSGDLDIDQFTFMASAGRRLSPHVEGLLSLAYFNLSTDLAVRVLEQRQSASRDADWIDPLLGLQYAAPFADKWSYTLRGDIGGFGIGSDLSWQLLTVVRRQNTDRFSWFVGYRALGFDYEDGKGANFQHYDLTQQGPLAGIAISF